jgi:hypothetical protein
MYRLHFHIPSAARKLNCPKGRIYRSPDPLYRGQSSRLDHLYKQSVLRPTQSAVVVSWFSMVLRNNPRARDHRKGNHSTYASCRCRLAGSAQAFENREIRAEELPPEFRFITHDTKLQEVIDKLGKPSRILKVPINAGRGLGYALVSSNTGNAAIVVYEYDLPYHAAVIVMPEFPFDMQNRIRAVFYRSIQPDFAEATE